VADIGLRLDNNWSLVYEYYDRLSDEQYEAVRDAMLANPNR
jgi:hypothetical protein